MALSALPFELLDEVASYLPINSIAALVASCKRFHAAFSHCLNDFLYDKRRRHPVSYYPLYSYLKFSLNSIQWAASRGAIRTVKQLLNTGVWKIDEAISRSECKCSVILGGKLCHCRNTPGQLARHFGFTDEWKQLLVQLRKNEVENTNTAQVEAIYNATASSESHLIISEKSDNQNTENVYALGELSKKVRVLSTISTDHPSNTRSDTVRSESKGGEH
jgi:hypothetical protein